MMQNYKNIYFLGIGGIGMSAIAKYFLAQNFIVYGYDLKASKITDELISLGAKVSFNESLLELALLLKEDTLVVYTPAISENNNLKQYFIKKEFFCLKRAQVLGQIASLKNTLAVAGTHGKTSTSTMLAYLLNNSSIGCSAFLGGVSTDYQSNLLIDNESDFMVVEADEFDRSFLTLYPNNLILTSTDADHLDVYGSKENLIDTFHQFISQVKSGGVLLVSEEAKESVLPINRNDLIVKTYGFNADNDYVIFNYRIENGVTLFDVKGEINYGNLISVLPGKHNVKNLTSAIILASYNGVEINEINKSLPKFKGINRRFEYKVKRKDKIVISDYAHHPKEIDAALETFKKLYPNSKSVVVFQPHLYSRTSDFMDQFAESLSKADKVVLLDIFPARELPIEGVSSNVLLAKIQNNNKLLLEKSQVLDYIKNESHTLFLGAGDIDLIADKLKEEYV